MVNFTSWLYNEEGCKKRVTARGRFDFFLDSAVVFLFILQSKCAESRQQIEHHLAFRNT